jgi:hypothetical protein
MYLFLWRLADFTQLNICPGQSILSKAYCPKQCVTSRSSVIDFRAAYREPTQAAGHDVSQTRLILSLSYNHTTCRLMLVPDPCVF